MKQARTDNASLLEGNINQIFSSEKLNGDAGNLYFDFLRIQSGIWSKEMGICKFLLLSFIALTSRNIYILQTYKQQHSVGVWTTNGSSTPSYWEPLPAVLSVLNLCLYIYNFARCTTATYQTIIDTIKEGFIGNKLQWSSNEDKTLFQKIIRMSPHLNVPSKRMVLPGVYSF